MNKPMKALLDTLTPVQLVAVIEELHGHDKDSKALVEQAISSYDPKLLYKLVTKQIGALKRGRRFIQYREAPEFADQLDRINTAIEKLVKADPEKAITVCIKFIEIDGQLCERVDDSGGFLSMCYTTTHELLDQAFVCAKTSPEEVATTLLRLYAEDEYGVRSYLLDQCKQSLRQGADQVIEEKLPDSGLNDTQVYSVLTLLADVRNDVDAYIELVTQRHEQQHPGKPLFAGYIIQIVKRLNNAFRSEEAIEWLNNMDKKDTRYEHKKTTLLLEAYELEGKTKDAIALLWQRFSRYLRVDDFLAYCKKVDDAEQALALNKAIELATQHGSLSFALNFLKDIEQWEQVEKMVMEAAMANTLEGYDYSLYRKLSTTLAKQGYALPAVLLRRVLVSNVLSKGISKYYPYAVSDLKKAEEFASQVVDWKAIEPHPLYLASLNSQHARKHGFWSRVNEE